LTNVGPMHVVPAAIVWKHEGRNQRTGCR
jgi:hypothetical protein